MTDQPTVFVVDDDAGVRQSLRWLLESVEIRVETFDSAEAFLTAYDPRRPGCLILDVRMPGLSGLSLQQRLLELDAHLPIIIVTGHADVAMAVRAMKAGAFHLLEKPVNDQVLLDHVQDAIAKDLDCLHERSQLAELRARFAALSPREIQVMDLVVAGLANKQIARRLNISPKTVEIHRSRIMRKMDAASIAELVQMSLSIAKGQGLATHQALNATT